MDAQRLEEEKIGGGYDAAETSSNEVPENLRPASKRGFLGTLRYYEGLMDKKLGVEAHAIARKLPEERDPNFAKWHNQAVMFLLWMSSTMNLSCFVTGFLGWEFELDLRRSIVLLVFGTLCGSCVTVSAFSTYI